MLDLNQTVETLIKTGAEVANVSNELQRVREHESIQTVEGVTYIRRGGALIPPQNFPSTMRAFAGLDSILAYRRYIKEHFQNPAMLFWVGDGRQ